MTGFMLFAEDIHDAKKRQKVEITYVRYSIIGFCKNKSSPNSSQLLMSDKVRGNISKSLHVR